MNSVIWVMFCVRAMAISLLLLSCSITTGALGSQP